MAEKQKQKQKQSVNVVVNVGHAKLRRKVKRRVRAPRTKRNSAMSSLANYYNQPLTRMVRQDVVNPIPYTVFNPLQNVKTVGGVIKSDMPVEQGRLDAEFTDGSVEPSDAPVTQREVETPARGIGRANARQDLNAEFGGMELTGGARARVKGSSWIDSNPPPTAVTPRTIIRGYLMSSATPRTVNLYQEGDEK
jgi:hypothetical protein